MIVIAENSQKAKHEPKAVKHLNYIRGGHETLVSRDVVLSLPGVFRASLILIFVQSSHGVARAEVSHS